MSDTVCMINPGSHPCTCRELWLTGWNAGWFLHAVLVGNLAYLHGWMNLYNNIFRQVLLRLY